MTEPTTLADRIFAELKRRGGQKAAELASSLGVERREVNRCLSYVLTGKVQQSADYRWSLRDANAPESAPGAKTAPLSDIARLCRYFLECIGQDMDEGVSDFAANRYGEPPYSELPGLPQLLPDDEWLQQPGTLRVLGNVRQDAANLLAWVGYPVKLRHHRTAKWEGFFVEPVLLWRVDLGANGRDAPRILEDAPQINPKFLRSVAMGDGSQLAEESARLSEELGLNVPIADLPEPDELIERLVRIRPDWGWRESCEPVSCPVDPPLSNVVEEGIYNRAVLIPGKRSPFTQGLESELKALSEVPASQLKGTALDLWLTGVNDPASAADDKEPLIEVVPLNTEQRAAVRAALSAPHTVVTGPPGTGKSQVVTNLLVNAAWRGMKVLFASKNNKAVDVVEARVNGLGNRPVLLRMGSKEYQAKLADYLSQMLAGSPGADDEQQYQEGLSRHKAFSSRMAELDRLLQQTLDARNTADRLDVEAEQARALLPVEAGSLDESRLRFAEQDIQKLETAIDRTEREKQDFLTRLFWSWTVGSRRSELLTLVQRLAADAAVLGVMLPDPSAAEDAQPLRDSAVAWRDRIAVRRNMLQFEQAMAVLRESPAFEDIARQRADLMEKIAQNSQRLWRDWVQLAPKRLSAAQRKDIADYAAVLQLTTGPGSDRVNKSVYRRSKELQSKVTELFSCWAVTSLSARGRLPFEPGYFDLVVIDEASQCDIASALPLLFRARRSVIIGDPQQLRHISALSRSRDSDLQHRHGLVDTHVGWMYSVSSLYDVATGIVPAENIINLRDHHRSHADIIQFANHAFYLDRLRVATRYDRLKRPRNADPGVIWQDVRGAAFRPSSGGAQNEQEAKAVVAALEDLLVTRGYRGTVGVVTPFRAQAQLLQELVTASNALAGVRDGCELLVDTVHKFQGDERDVMFFSPVVSRNMPNGAQGFLRGNGNLFNVAITRARGLLHVVGDRSAAAASGVSYLADFAAYVSSLERAKQAEGVRGESATYGPEYPVVAHPERVSDWERVLYRALYAAGVRAIPQYSVEQYALDFAVIVGDRRLNIEVDGERYHRSWTGELCLRDQLRNMRLIELGWDVRRFWVYEVRDDLDACVQTIVDWVAAAQEGT